MLACTFRERAPTWSCDDCCTLVLPGLRSNAVGSLLRQVQQICATTLSSILENRPSHRPHWLLLASVLSDALARRGQGHTTISGVLLLRRARSRRTGTTDLPKQMVVAFATSDES